MGKLTAYLYEKGSDPGRDENRSVEEIQGMSDVLG